MNTTIEEIKKCIVHNYLQGAFNETNIDAFREAFHPEFTILNPQENGSLYLFTRQMWQEVLEKRRNDPRFDFTSVALAPRFRTIDAENSRAAVTLDLLLNGKMVYTDFLLLIQINGRWKIVSKVYHEHK